MILKGAKLLTRLKPRALAALPSAVVLRAGTAYEITDYGGNVAVAVNGAWRFEFPFRTTWANRPPVGLVSPGTELQATDYDNQKWVCDGTYWRPAQGRVLLDQQWGYNTSPLAVIMNSANGVFAVPGGNPIVRACMLIPHSTLHCYHVTRKIGANGNCGINSRLGTSGTTGDCVIATATTSASTSLDTTAGAARVGNLTNKMYSIQWIGSGVSQGSTTSVGNDGSTNFNTAADMQVSFHVTSANAADTFNLLGYEVWLEA